MEPGSHVPDFATDGEGLSRLWSEAAEADDDSIARRQSSIVAMDNVINEQMGDDSSLARQKSGAIMRQKSCMAALQRQKSSAYDRLKGGSGALMRRKSSGTGLLESGVIARAVVASADRNIDEGEAAFVKGPARAPSIRQALLLREAALGANEEDLTVFENDDEADRLQDVTFTFADMAALDMCALRGGSIDVIPLIHNAVRVEIECAVTMVCAMRRIGADLTVGDLMAFRDWWLVALDVFLDYLDVEVKVILPWIRNCIAKNDQDYIAIETVLSRTPVGQTEVRKLAKAVTTAFGRSIEGSPRAIGEAGRKRRERLTIDLVVAFDRFITQIISHMFDQEASHMAQGVRNGGVDYEEMVKQVVLHIVVSAKQPEVLLVLCGRWMRDAKYFKSYQRVVKDNTEFSYNKLLSLYELNHGATVAVFKVKAGIN